MSSTRPDLTMTVVDCSTGEMVTRPFTAAERRDWEQSQAEAAANPPPEPRNELAELRAQIEELQNLVATLTKAVQTSP